MAFRQPKHEQGNENGRLSLSRLEEMSPEKKTVAGIAITAAAVLTGQLIATRRPGSGETGYVFVFVQAIAAGAYGVWLATSNAFKVVRARLAARPEKLVFVKETENKTVIQDTKVA